MENWLLASQLTNQLTPPEAGHSPEICSWAERKERRIGWPPRAYTSTLSKSSFPLLSSSMHHTRFCKCWQGSKCESVQDRTNRRVQRSIEKRISHLPLKSFGISHSLPKSRESFSWLLARSLALPSSDRVSGPKHEASERAAPAVSV